MRAHFGHFIVYCGVTGSDLDAFDILQRGGEVGVLRLEVLAVPTPRSIELYNPEKLEKIDTIMFRYKGRETDLLKDLKD
eukprot:COSAG02_NODE_34360_length_485_cov_0.927461_2_plen_78_part_01